ncbi:unnamed protein product [Fraxinus pennsylvanica]|uniref:Uncharacterized protein n=1 Tax=Fraxinus pennsylvanica TaxID=56036 RepID=A0AAD1ZAZ2_9LAMI|nr:unnamed protein product [Fraxinus pennsylvanica]
MSVSMAIPILFSQLDELELKDFLASDPSEADDNFDDNVVEDRSVKICTKKDMYCALVQSGDGGSDDNDEDNAQDMEVTFNTGLEDINEDVTDTEHEHVEQADDFFVEEETQLRGTKREKPNQEKVQEAEASRAELELLLADDTGMDNNLKL